MLAESSYDSCEFVLVLDREMSQNMEFYRNATMSTDDLTKVLPLIWGFVGYGSASVSYVLIGYYLNKISKFLKKEKSRISSFTYAKLQSFYYVNLGQALLPVLTMILPTVTNIAASLLRIENVHGLGFVIFLSFAILPILDPIFPLYFIKQYRRALRLKCNQIKNKISLKF